jgi:lysophospholipase L1-like esterase
MITRATHLSISTGGCDFIDLWEKNLISWTNLIQTIQRVNQNARKILSFLRSQNPQADMYVLGFYLPLPAYQFGVKRVKWMVKRLNRCYQAICKENRAYFLDPFDLFFEKRELFADEVHPNQKGYNVIAEHFINHLGAQSRHSSIGVQANPPFSS